MNMQVKIDTKEKFTVITPVNPGLHDNLAEEATQILLPYLQKDIKNIVLNLREVKTMETEFAGTLASLQQKFYENNVSFVICCVNQQLEDFLEELEILEIMNTAPTETEAWDIVQMEEIERELLDDIEPLFNDHHERERD
jgi:anti-anti-sigma factor